MRPRLLLTDINAVDGVARLASALGAALTDASDYIHAVSAVAVRHGAEGNRELGAVGVGACVGHAQYTGALKLEGKCAGLVVELIARAALTCAGRVTPWAMNPSI